MSYETVVEFALWKNTKPKSEKSPPMTGTATFTCPNCQHVTEKISTTAFTNKPDGSNKPLVSGRGQIDTSSPVDTVTVPAVDDDFSDNIPF
jgi:hypothetical protein